ncbi:MAG: DNA polymerase III subunit delta' [Clostridiales bacterium]|nr:DNA polymerase III subunit delta' [Clostridiales bacterium]
MSFNLVIGHEKEKLYLQQVIKEKRLPHAMMLEGPEGIGKLSLGLQMTQAVFCDSITGDACGVCRNCIKMMHDNHPDFMLIEPDGNQIKNAQIESFQEFVNIKPYDAAYKVIIIKDAHKMNASSQNRILKTLEEPPAHVIVIMLTTNSESLLPTVLSRALIIKLSGVHQNLVVDYLKAQYETSQEDAELIAKLSEGSIGRAIEYMTSDSFEEIRKHTEIILDSIHGKERSKLLGELSYFTAEKENIHKVLDYMILWYRDILLFKQAKAKHLLVHSQSIDFIKKLTRNLSLKKIIQNIEVIETTKRKLRQHAHFDLTIEVMLIKLLEE